MAHLPVLELHIDHLVAAARLVSENELHTQAILGGFVAHQVTQVVLLHAYLGAVVKQHNASRADPQQSANVHLQTQ